MSHESLPRHISVFSDVDSADAGSLMAIIYLIRLNKVPAIKEYKQRARELLDPQPGESILDVGCGTGEGLRAIYSYTQSIGSLVGIDKSNALIAESINSTSKELLTAGKFIYQQGDAHKLSFEDGRFDATYADRTFQHLDNPDQAFREMLRVTKRGGRILIADTDWTTLQLAGISAETAEKIKLAHLNIVLNPQMGGRLKELFSKQDLIDIKVARMSIEMPDFETIQTVLTPHSSLELASKNGAISTEDVQQSLEEVRGAKESIKGSFNVYIVKGVVR